MTQVIHHLTPDSHQTAITAIGKVLKPGGTFWIQTSTPHQEMNGFWWTILIPNAASRVAERMTAIPVFQKQIKEATLTTISIDVPLEPLMRKDLYLDANAPFNETFRNSDSTWSLASEEELQSGLEWWK